jgi:hypothetical protein
LNEARWREAVSSHPAYLETGGVSEFWDS